MLEKIQYLCKQHNITLSKLERELGFGRGSIYKWETNSPSIDKVEKVADFFDVSIDELLDRPFNWAFSELESTLRSAIQDLLGDTDIDASDFSTEVKKMLEQESEHFRVKYDVNPEFTPDGIIQLCSNIEFPVVILDLIDILRRVKARIQSAGQSITLAAHKVDGYDDNLTEEEQAAVNAFIEAYRKQFNK